MSARCHPTLHSVSPRTSPLAWPPPLAAAGAAAFEPGGCRWIVIADRFDDTGRRRAAAGLTGRRWRACRTARWACAETRDLLLASGDAVRHPRRRVFAGFSASCTSADAGDGDWADVVLAGLLLPGLRTT